MKNTILFLMSAVGLMMTACVTDTTLAVDDATESNETVVSEDSEVSDGATVRFKFSSGTVSSRADDDEDEELQSEEEKAVTSLIAVIFYDTDEGVGSSWESADTHEDDDVYYTYFTVDEISEDTPLEEGTVYSFNIGTDGVYQICFVANAPEELLDGIDALESGTSTLEDFKNIEVTQDPGTKPMTMTSTFYGIISEELLSFDDDDAATIDLSRIMARIDVITNSSESLIITGITLKNRTTTSVIYNDNITTLNEDYIGDDYSATGLTLQYDPDAEDESAYYYSEKIYSYENFADAESDYVPTLVLTYTFEGNESSKYQHKVEFVQTVDGVSTALTLQRNYRYLVNVSYDGGDGLVYSISIVDWNSETEFTVTGDDLKGGYDDDEDAEDEEDEEDEEETSYASVDMGDDDIEWATMNVGADSPEDYGDYYAWGEIYTKETYTKDNCTTNDLDLDDISGNATYDVATAKWGDDWRMPTKEEVQALMDECTLEFTTENGINCALLTASNGNTILLPTGGFWNYSTIWHLGDEIAYWTATAGESATAILLRSSTVLYFNNSASRYQGCLVRPVRELYQKNS